MTEDFRVFQHLAEKLASFNASPGQGVTRLAFSDADQASRQWLRDIWTNMGLSTHIDGAGNVVGTVGSPPYVLLGSHTDTVPQGGQYDGILGVLAATVIAYRWKEPAGLLLVDWSSEESSRFGIGTIGSRLALEEGEESFWSTVDPQGIRLDKAMQEAYGYPDTPILNLKAYPIRAAIELHIEQGTQLAEQQVPIGVVTAIAAPQRWRVTIVGQANHSAGTPMTRRRDALVALSQLVLHIEQLSRALESQGLRSTVTQTTVIPGAANVIPGEVSAIVDVRVQSAPLLMEYQQKIQAFFRELQSTRNVHMEWTDITTEPPGLLDPSLQEVLRESLSGVGIPYVDLPSWPSHDSLPLSRHVPTAMLLVRNRSGLSHNAGEEIKEDDIMVALQAYDTGIRAVHGAMGGGTLC